jgi:hypothetical protein
MGKYSPPSHRKVIYRAVLRGFGFVVAIAACAWAIWLIYKSSAPSAGWLLPLSPAVLVVLLLLLWKVPQWQVGRVSRLSSKERFDRVNEARKTLATILGGVLLLLGFFGTWENIRVAQENLAVSEQGQITDRFTKAIEQLGATDATGKPRLEVRLGAIYALERIANDSERDRWPIMEVLCTYVRENARREYGDSTGVKGTKKNQSAFSPPKPRADIQAILTVLGRRNFKYETIRQQLDLHGTDLRGVVLYGAVLGGANLSGADLGSANLKSAELGGADLSLANLKSANLSSANFFLVGADLEGADLRGADLSAADLSSVIGLTQDQINKARGDLDTKLPVDQFLDMPDSWKK